jgi:hypothetical protein
MNLAQLARALDEYLAELDRVEAEVRVDVVPWIEPENKPELASIASASIVDGRVVLSLTYEPEPAKLQYWGEEV